MTRVLKLLLSLILLFSLPCFSQTSFKIDRLKSGIFNNRTKISLTIHGKTIGFASFTKIPFFSYYALHSLYVYPQYRNKGFGSKIMTYTENYLQSMKAQRIYIQPGPFEINRDISNNNSYNTKTKQLVKLYRKLGYKLCHRITQFFARVVYRCMGIDENADYLMVKNME